MLKIKAERWFRHSSERYYQCYSCQLYYPETELVEYKGKKFCFECDKLNESERKKKELEFWIEEEID
jgi:hypothetical protein